MTPTETPGPTLTGRPGGFTLLEVIVALAILALALMAIFNLNSGAVAMHAYTKKVSVATLLARSKMTDIEQDLYDNGFPEDDDERSGDFSTEGWTTFKWRAKIIAPKLQDLSSDQLIAALFGLPVDALGSSLGSSSGSGSDPLTGMLAMFAPSMASAATGSSGASGSMGSLTSALSGPMAGLAQGQMGQFVQQIQQYVREVHLTVSWKDGKQVETLDLVTHIISAGPGSDRNGVPGAGSSAAAAVAQNDPYVNAQTGALVPNPITNAQGQLVDPANPSVQVIPLSQFQALRAQQGIQPTPNGAGNPLLNNPRFAQPNGFGPNGLPSLGGH